MRPALLVAIFGCITSNAQVDLARGLIGSRPFSCNAKDYSPLANEGSVTGAKLAADRFGNPNAAYEFDVVGICPKDLPLNNFTYSLWVRPMEFLRNAQPGIFFCGSDFG